MRNIDGNNVSDEWIATFLLAGLSSRYDPMIMAMESSNIAITSDAVKTKLLQDVKPEEISPDSKAFFFKGNRRGGRQQYAPTHSSHTTDNKRGGNIRCYGCQEFGHISKHCPKKKKNAMTVGNHSDQNFLRNQSSSSGNGYYCGFSAFSHSNDDWIIDSGASYAMTGRNDWIKETSDAIIDEIMVANNAKMKVISTGKVLMNVDCEGEVKTIPVNNVLHVPDLSVNLLSVSQIVLNDYTVVFDKFGCRIYDSNNKLHSTGRHVNNSFVLNSVKMQLINEQKQRSVE